MKRYSEMVLNGHPDKFCDLVADRLIRELYKKDPEAYAQIEVSVWSDQIFLTGGTVTRNKASLPVRDIIVELGYEIGYVPGNAIDASQYKISDHICWITGDPTQWTHYSNDQCLVVGYAGYDEKTNYLPPEHYLSGYLREQIISSFNNGVLKGQGPDGKLLVVIHEDHDGWKPETILLTLQQNQDISFFELVSLAEKELKEAWQQLKQKDKRWKGDWDDMRILINPNGPLLNGGSDGDNGQTGRKLVMDYYGPRIPLGGGALYGKDLAHIDRVGAFNARRFAIEMVSSGAEEAMIRVCYAPGMSEPLSVDIISDKRPNICAEEYFSFDSMRSRISLDDIHYDLGRLGSFYNVDLSFNDLVVI